MANTATLAIQIISDATKAAKGFQQATRETSKLERGLGAANRVAIATGAALLAVGAASVKQASQLQQSSGAVQATFGKQSAAVQRLAKQADDAVGLSRASYQQLAATFGAQLKNMGVASSQLVPKTDELITLGADLAATYGGTTSQAVEALGSLLRGERDPIEKYGVSIKQADINAVLAAKGQDKLTGAAKKTAETQATLSLLTKQTADAQGQFARESGSAEGAAQRMQAKLDNAAASKGTVLLPAVTAAADALAGLATYVEGHSAQAQIAVGVIAALAAVVIAANVAFGAYAAAQALVAGATAASTGATIANSAATTAQRIAYTVGRVAALAFAGAQRVVNAVLRANPIGLVITAVALLIGGLILAYKNSAKFRAAVQAAGKAGQIAIGWVVTKARELWNWIGPKLGAVWTATKIAAVAAFDAIAKPVRKLIDFVSNLISKIRNIKWPKPPAWVSNAGSALGSLLSSYTEPGMARGAAYALAPSVFTRPGELKASGPDWMVGRMGGQGGPSVISITVNGAIDADSVARQLEGILTGRSRRLGRYTR
jgi:hypothetical protein